MSYPQCKVHPGRVAELVCLSNECSKRLTLQCTICINSTCKRHNWKLMTEAIEEIFELCQNEQARDEKRKRQGTQIQTQQTSNKDDVERLLSEFTKKLKIREEQIMANVNLRAQGLLTKSTANQQLYVIVKNKINDFRKSDDRSINSLNGILDSIKPCIQDDEGMLLFTSEPSTKGGIQAPQVREFENYLNSFLEGARLLRANSQNSQQQSSVKTGGNQKQIQELKQNYQSQINNLIEQVKSIPILKSRIDAINLKLQAKDQKLKKYQEGGSSNSLQPPTINPMKSSQIINQKVKESQVKAKRIQKLLEIREKLKSLMYNYTIKNQSEQVQLHKLLRNQDAHLIQVNNCYTDQAQYLNIAMVVIADELNYLEHNDRQENDPYIQVQVVTKKSTDYRSNTTRLGQQRDPLFGLGSLGGLGRHLGSTTRNLFPSYY